MLIHKNLGCRPAVSAVELYLNIKIFLYSTIQTLSMLFTENGSNDNFCTNFNDVLL